MEDQNNKPPYRGGNRPPRRPKMPFNLYWIYFAIFLAIALMWYYSDKDGMGSRSKDVTWTEFQTYLVDNMFTEVTVDGKTKQAKGIIKPDSVGQVFGESSTKAPETSSVYAQIPSVEAFSNYYESAKENHEIDANINYVESSSPFEYIGMFLPFIFIIAIWIFMMRRMSGGGSGGGGVFGVGKSKAQLYEKGNQVNVSFKDVAGLVEAKEEIVEIVEFLKNPSRYTEIGAKIPKGALLVGPPGTGKTLLAKAVAGEANVPFFSMSGSDFVEMFVGVGASRVRDLFKQAKEKAPCIIFIDEIDAVGRARGKNPNMGSNDERENTLNQLLTEMDGFGTNSGIIVLAATNRADILDKALLRAGRFDRQIYVNLPDVNERKAIFKVHLLNIKIDDSVDLDLMSRQTPGFSGADIANVCNEAALIAARGGKTIVQKEDFSNAIDRIVGGLEKKTKVTTYNERRTIAIHEAGHATLSWFLEHANPLVKVTIVPRGKALGAAWYLPEERQITTKEQMLDEICALLGGRAAEEVFVGAISSGAVNDLERVTKQAYAMVSYMGMSDTLPNLSYYDSQSDGMGFTKPYSEETALAIDKEVKKMINEQYERAKMLLKKHNDGHNKLSEILMTEEVIFSEDLKKIFGERQWKSRSDEIMKNDGKRDSRIFEDAEEVEEIIPAEDVINHSSNDIEGEKSFGNA